MIQIFKIEGIYIDWSCEVEMYMDFTLDDLHCTILNAVGFDNDHLYEFFIARSETGYNAERIDYDNDKMYELTLEELFPLPKGKKLFFLFDYGDHWLFQISKSRKKPYNAINGVQYPRVIKSTGEKPLQYPDSDEEFDEDEDN